MHSFCLQYGIYFIAINAPFFKRGGNSNNAFIAGVFSANTTSGGTYTDNSFRVVLTI